MPTATITSKGQTTIPQAIREHLQLKPGDRVEFIVGEDGLVVMRPVTRSILDLRGMLARPGQKRLSIAAMDAAVRRRFARR